MSSGDRAVIAASQAQTDAQRESFREALAFTKEQFEQAKSNRAPYLQGGVSAMGMLMNLMGLNRPINGVNLNPGGTLKDIANYGAGGVRSSSSGGGGSTGGGGTTGALPGTSPGSTSKGPADTFTPVFQKPTTNPNDAFYEERFPYFDWTKQPMPGGGAKSSSLLSVTSGGNPTVGDTNAGSTAVPVMGPDGSEQWVPASLVPMYRNRGFTVRES